jgi:hypothetical protein
MKIVRSRNSSTSGAGSSNRLPRSSTELYGRNSTICLARVVYPGQPRDHGHRRAVDVHEVGVRGSANVGAADPDPLGKPRLVTRQLPGDAPLGRHVRGKPA